MSTFFAIFDMDHTLVDADVPGLWLTFLCDIGRLPREETLSRKAAYDADYSAGTLDMPSYIKFETCAQMRWPADELDPIRAQFIQEYVLPRVTLKARSWLKTHKDAGDHCLLLSATNDYLADAVAAALEIPSCLATQMQWADGLCTGQIIGPPCLGEGKVERLKIHLQEQELDWPRFAFYSDSHNDLPLLKLADQAIAVDPDPQLHAYASRAGWRILSKR